MTTSTKHRASAANCHLNPGVSASGNHCYVCEPETSQPTAAILRGAEAVRSLYLADQTQPVSYFVETVQEAVDGALDVEEMAAAYADAQFGPGGWDDAPAVIRNDIRTRMQRVIDTIVGKP